MKPFFTIVMRACRRPNGLENALQSVLAQTCKDWEAVFLVDKAGAHPEGNVLWANSQFQVYKDRFDGHYILALDDDGEYPNKDFLALVKQEAILESFPECVLVRSVSPRNPKGDSMHNLPSRPVWRIGWELGERPGFWYGHGYNWCCRNDIFKSFVGAYCKPRGGDWHFMTALIRGGVDFVRCNVFGGKSLSRGRGEKFENCASDWWEKIAKKYNLWHNGDDWRLRRWQK